MTKEALENRRVINHAKNALALGWMTYDEAKEYTEPVIRRINEKAKEIAKKQGMKPRFVNFSSLMR